MQRQLRWVLVMQLRWVLVMMALMTLSALCSPAMAADPYLSDMIKKPVYARALRSLLDQTPNLPSWTRETLKSKSDMIGTSFMSPSVGSLTRCLRSACRTIVTSPNCSSSLRRTAPRHGAHLSTKGLFHTSVHRAMRKQQY
jgi:hypothetical protein